MKLFRIFLPHVLLMMIFLPSCMHDVVIPNSPEVHFQSDVQPIIIGHCTESGCHSSGSDHPNALVTYDDISRTVNPGDARNSSLYERIVGKSGELMPPSPKPMLSEDQIKWIYLWIEQGAKNN